MNTLPAAFPCWPCLKQTVLDANHWVQHPEGTQSNTLLDADCRWESAGFRDGRCHQCRSDNRLVCGSVPGFLGNYVKGFVKAMAYVSMTINLDKPQEQFRIRRQPEPSGGQHRILPFEARKDLIAAIVLLGFPLMEIVERHLTQPNMNTRPRYVEGLDQDYLRWNAAIREFYGQVIQSLKDSGVDGGFTHAVMENIPVQWTPAVDKEAIHEAKQTLLGAYQ